MLHYAFAVEAAQLQKTMIDKSRPHAIANQRHWPASKSPMCRTTSTDRVDCLQYVCNEPFPAVSFSSHLRCLDQVKERAVNGEVNISHIMILLETGMFVSKPQMKRSKHDLLAHTLVRTTWLTQGDRYISRLPTVHSISRTTSMVT